MEQSKRNNSKKSWLLVKFLIAGASLWFIYQTLLGKASLKEWLEVIRVAVKTDNHPQLFALVMLMMLINWSLEAVKWRMMISKIETLGFFRSLEAVFSGLTVSFFTPNRVGEFAGRVFHLGKADRIEATLITVVENLSQLIITLVAGSIFSIVYIHHFVSIPDFIRIALSILLFLFALSCVLLYLNVSILQRISGNSKRVKSWHHYLRVFSLYSSRELFVVLFLAAIRYLVFSTQFYLLLILFGIQINFWLSLVLISMTYFAMTIVPTIAWLELGIRGTVAAYFFSAVVLDISGVVNASITLWIINVVVPALIGSLFVFGFKLGKRREQ
ncbi:MAG TPA: lysylphosphatidylglycerol synthase transmembrane domain-containing protein [Bacteroidia bacterium]|nr:lysylphosphatidylglycerol synthase transmembrane domain-containing protein [Bacteroidia bacterium]